MQTKRRRSGLSQGIFLFGLVLMSGCGQEAPVPQETIKPIRIFTVGESLLKGDKEFIGRAEASRSADLSFRVSGRLIELSVKQGEWVTEGQVIARLDPRDYETRSREVQSQLDQAQAVLTQMKAGARAEDVNRMKAALAARQSELDEAQAEFERYESLLKTGVVSRQEFDRIKTRRDGVRASLENANQELAIGQRGARAEEIAAQTAQIRSFEARLQEVRNNLADTALKAPFAGVVARIDARGFEDVQANQPILNLQMTDPIDILIHITEQDMAQGRDENQPADNDRIVAEVRFPAVGETWYPVRVKEFQTEADPQTQTFEVVMQMDQPASQPIRPGMNAVVRGESSHGSGAGGGFYIPLNALFADPQGGKCVWLIDPESMRVKARPVSTSRIVDDQIEVIDGLAPGDRIAVSAVNLLLEGMPVEVMKDLGAL